MKHWTFAGSTALVTLALTAPSWADVTPEEVWQNWQDLSGAYGQTITTESVERDGDTLVVTGLQMAYAKDDVSATGTIVELRLRDTGDGAVEITMSDTIPFDMTVPAEEEGGTPTEIGLLITQPGMVVIAAGDVAETSYDFTAPSVTVALDSIEGVDAEKVEMDAEFVLTNMAGKYLLGGTADARGINSSFQADSVAINVSGSNPEDQSSGVFAVTMADLSGTTNGTFLDMAAMEDMAAALKAGFATEGTFAYGATTYSFDVTEATGPTKMTGTADGGNLTFALDATRMAYGGSAKAASMTISGPEIPFPELAFGYSEAAFNFEMPVGPTPEPANFALLTKLVDVTVSDDLWGMIDPAASLPRDPATIVIDTTGTAKLTASIMDPAAMETLGDTPPGELYSLDVNEIRASIAGAELTGAGAFTFDNTDLVTFGGMPAPTGKLDLKLVGGNTLMDRLVAMGLLPEDQVMGFRMMLSMFANAGPGEDELNSTLEFKDKGFFANGQRLQ